MPARLIIEGGDIKKEIQTRVMFADDWVALVGCTDQAVDYVRTDGPADALDRDRRHCARTYDIAHE